MAIQRKQTPQIPGMGYDDGVDTRMPNEPPYSPTPPPQGPLSPGTSDIGTPDDSGRLPPLPGNSEGPRDRTIPEPPTQNAPGGVQRQGLPGASPSRPIAPSPIAAMSPRPFTPLTPPRGMQGAALAPSSNLLGKAGGLLGGGLGVPGSVSGDTQDVSSLIAALLQKMRGGQ